MYFWGGKWCVPFGTANDIYLLGRQMMCTFWVGKWCVPLGRQMICTFGMANDIYLLGWQMIYTFWGGKWYIPFGLANDMYLLGWQMICTFWGGKWYVPLGWYFIAQWELLEYSQNGLKLNKEFYNGECFHSNLYHIVINTDY